MPDVLIGDDDVDTAELLAEVRGGLDGDQRKHATPHPRIGHGGS